MINNRRFIIHKVCYKKGSRDMTMIFIKKIILTPKQVANVFDLGYLGIQKDFPDQLYPHYRTERREVWDCHKKK